MSNLVDTTKMQKDSSEIIQPTTQVLFEDEFLRKEMDSEITQEGSSNNIIYVTVIVIGDTWLKQLRI